MPSAIDILVHSLTASKEMVMNFCQDLSVEDYLHRPAPGANCAAWLLGHLTVTDRSIMKRVMGATDLPPLPDGYEPRFGRDVATAQAKEFGDTSILLPLFSQTRDLLITKVQSWTDDDFDRPLPFEHPRFKTTYGAVNFMGVHSAMHAGQLSTIRRSLGRPPLV